MHAPFHGAGLVVQVAAVDFRIIVALYCVRLDSCTVTFSDGTVRSVAPHTGVATLKSMV